MVSATVNDTSDRIRSNRCYCNDRNLWLFTTKTCSAILDMVRKLIKHWTFFYIDQKKILEFSEKFETSVDLKEISLHTCECEQRFLSNKSLKKHRQTCQQVPKGRGYLPPALQRMHQSTNSLSLSEQARRSSTFDRWNRLNENRPPDVDYFLHDDDNEVARAFGLETNNQSTNHNDLNRTPSQSKSKMKIAAYPPKSQSGTFELSKDFDRRCSICQDLQVPMRKHFSIDCRMISIVKLIFIVIHLV